MNEEPIPWMSAIAAIFAEEDPSLPPPPRGFRHFGDVEPHDGACTNIYLVDIYLSKEPQNGKRRWALAAFMLARDFPPCECTAVTLPGVKVRRTTNVKFTLVNDSDESDDFELSTTLKSPSRRRIVTGEFGKVPEDWRPTHLVCEFLFKCTAKVDNPFPVPDAEEDIRTFHKTTKKKIRT